MIIAKKYFILIYLLACPVFLIAQTPSVVPLDYNPVLRDRQPRMLKNDVQADTVALPFFDDFSYYSRSSKPDRRLWMDDYVFINNSYPDQPRSNGVATFDALDADGNIYQNTAATFPADTLTSCPIDLSEDGIRNVYLSFFYQPGGYGDRPDEGDSLILQFKSPVTKLWRTVWNIPGDSTHSFKQVLLPVNDEYLHKGFQFRFVNLVSLDQDKFNPGRRGNADHWHIDYVYLNKNRNENDTAYYDVAVIAPMKSLIKGYQSIPWNQLPDALYTKFDPPIEMKCRNNNNIPHNVYLEFTITDVYNNITTPLTSKSSIEIEANKITPYRQNIINPFEPLSVDSALFDIKGYLTTDDFDRKENDTVCLRQFFNDYFARDDGIPESGYGFFGDKTQACAVACRYETFLPDNLKAIRLYFNPTSNQITEKYRFCIAVWRDDNGRPGQLLYRSATEYSPKITGQFVQYNLDEDLYISKYYWIGWIQVTSGFLNVGFDRNYNDGGNLWYNNGSWRRDINNGTLMIRPVLGKRMITTSVENPITVMDVPMKLYPNPASKYIRIELDSLEPALFSDYLVEIYDVNGRLLDRAPHTGNEKDVSGFETGLYFIRLVNRKSGNTQTQKLIIE